MYMIPEELFRGQYFGESFCSAWKGISISLALGKRYHMAQNFEQGLETTIYLEGWDVERRLWSCLEPHHLKSGHEKHALSYHNSKSPLHDTISIYLHGYNTTSIDDQLSPEPNPKHLVIHAERPFHHH